MLRPILPRIGRSLGRRTYYSVPPLAFKPSEGIPGLLSNVGYDVAWTQYQSLMIDKINAMTVGMTSCFLNMNGLLPTTWFYLCRGPMARMTSLTVAPGSICTDVLTFF